MSQPATHAGRVTVRSYRGVFEFERRIYRIDRYRLSPGGVPVRGVLHLIVCAAVVFLAGRLPVLSSVLGAFPWTLRWVGIPVGLAVLTTILKLDGRPLHRALIPLVRFVVLPRRLAGFRAAAAPGSRWHPGEMVTALDGSGPRLPKLTYTGPGALVIRTPHTRSEHRPRLSRCPGIVTLEATANSRAQAKGIAMTIGGGVRVHVKD